MISFLQAGAKKRLNVESMLHLSYGESAMLIKKKNIFGLCWLRKKENK